MRRLCLAIAVVFAFPSRAADEVSDRLHQTLFGSRGEEGEATPGSEDEAGPGAAAQQLFRNRAYPADDIPADAAERARLTFDALASRSGNERHWSLVGPSVSLAPGITTYTGADYVTSGRVTALAIGPRCNQGSCRVWVGAAGGGIWRTDRALGPVANWRFVSGSFDTNAIGTIVVDPTDASGNTLYVGTGEPNASVDSAAGVGIYKTTDGGDTWRLLPGSRAAANGRAVSSIAIDPTNRNVIWIGTARAVRGINSVSGGGVSLNPAYPAWGLWKSTDGGNTFTPVATNNSTGVSHPDVGIRGVTDVALDPRDPSVVYFSAFTRGLRRISSMDTPAAGSVSVPIFANRTNSPSERTTFSVTVKNGKTRIYLGNGITGAPPSGVWRNDDVGQPAATVLATWKSLTTSTGTVADRADPNYATYNFCTGQCWYDAVVYTPKGYPDTVYVLGSYQYGEYWRISNSRGVLLSTTAGDPDPANNNRTFTDVSWDASSRDTPNGIHPDQHAIVVSPDNPNIFFEGSDGGVVRSDGTWQDISSTCATDRGYVPGTPNHTVCSRLLSKVPGKIISMNVGLSTLQFQHMSVSPRHPFNSVMGGTQDNGTWSFFGSHVLWTEAIGGDGGQSGYDAATDDLRFHSYYGPYIDVNYNGADPDKWLWVSDVFDIFPENWNFYVPITGDPVVSKTMFVGQQHVWRTKDSGGDPAFLATYCSETHAAPGPAPHPCGDFVPMGGAYGSPQGDLTSALYGADKRSSFDFVATITRAPSDRSTMWVGTNTGRLFVTRNADADPATAVAYTRIDTAATPNRFISGIAVDPANPNHAFVSYTGYSAVTPATPGHVFDVTVNPATGAATFRNLDSDGTAQCPAGVPPPGCDLPINGIVLDENTGDLYAGTDFGVLRASPSRSSASGYSWAAAGSELPKVAVTTVAIHSGARVLYAATHGRSAWRLMLTGGDGDDATENVAAR